MSLSVSVIVCCYTEERLADIRRAVASLWRQSRAPEEVIVVVDNNRELHRRLCQEGDGRTRLVLSTCGRGLSAARNAGIALARGDLVAFLDDDAVASPDWLERLTAPFADPSVLATGGRALLAWEGRRPPWLPLELEWTVGGSYTWLPQRETPVRNPHGHNMCFRRSVFQAVGGFHVAMGRVGDGVYAGEEAELCLRLRRALPHGKVLYLPLATVVHRVPRRRATLRYLLRRAFAEGRCKARLARLAGEASLTSERQYLRHLLLRALPSRLRPPWRSARLAQAAALALCTAATLAGFLAGSLEARRPVSPPEVRR